nr:hypothetical protein [Micromonospora orduensis]
MPEHVSSGYLDGDPNAIPVPDLDRTDLLDGCVGPPVVPDRRGHREEPLRDAGDHSGWGAPTVSFQVELAFEGVVDRLDPLPDTGEVAEAALLVLAVRAGQQYPDLLGGVPIDLLAGQALVGQHHR